MLYSFKDLFDEFYNTVKNDYPELTKDKIHHAVTYSWKILRKNMAEVTITSFRIKNFGLFLIRKRKVEHLKTREVYQKNTKKMSIIEKILNEEIK